MPISGNSEQNSKTLEAFYADLSRNSTKAYIDVGKQMLLLIELINETFKETLIWGLTSHARLVLQTEDKWDGDWLVIISNIGMKEYYFEYLIPADRQPWENAYVRGQADSIGEAKKYLLIAMKECGGWNNNAELKRLMAEYKIESI